MYVSIEGTVGVGKSTLLRFLSDCREIDFKTFAGEPVQEFQKLVGGQDLLALSYENPKKYAACAHTNILRILDNFFHKNLSSSKNSIITERSQFSTQVFVSAHLAEQNFEPVEALVLEQFQAHLFKDLPSPDCIIFLDTTFENCCQRIEERNRQAESNSQDQFFSTLYEAYHIFLGALQKEIPQRIHVLDASEGKHVVFQRVRNILLFESGRKNRHHLLQVLCDHELLNALCLESPTCFLDSKPDSSSVISEKVSRALTNWAMKKYAGRGAQIESAQKTM